MSDGKRNMQDIVICISQVLNGGNHRQRAALRAWVTAGSKESHQMKLKGGEWEANTKITNQWHIDMHVHAGCHLSMQMADSHARRLH
jgi:hypothetical protein